MQLNKAKKILRLYISNLVEVSLKNKIIDDYKFLSNYESAMKFAYENIDDVAESFDAYEEDPDDIHLSYSRDKYIELIELYVDKYNELKNKDTVTIHRLIVLKSLKDLNVNDIGIHWSFEKDGVGSYGGNHPGRVLKGKSYILEGETSPKNIDWKYGFHSFVWYGEDQWECALKTGAKVLVAKINNKKLEKPIIAKVGDH